MKAARLALALALATCSEALTLLRVAPRAMNARMLFGGGGKEGEGGGGLNMMETSERRPALPTQPGLPRACADPPRACVAHAVKKAQQVGLKVKELQDELQETEIEAVGADGGVTVVISGAQVGLAPLPPIRGC